MEEYCIKIWNETYINSANAPHTKLFIPTFLHRLSLPLWPNFILTKFLTNHGSFRSYLHKTNKMSSPTCNCPEEAVQTAHNLFSSEHPTSTSNPSLTSGSKVSHKYRRSHRLSQKHLPQASRAIERQSNSVTIPKQRTD